MAHELAARSEPLRERGRSVFGWGVVAASLAALLALLALRDAPTPDAASARDADAARSPAETFLAASRATRAGADPVATPPAAPAAPAPRRLLTILHGACTPREWVCDSLSGAAPADFAVVCPLGNARCEGGAPDWTGDGRARSATVEAAVTAARAEAGIAASPEGDVLIGFSRGGFSARDIVLAQAEGTPGPWRGLVFVGAAVSPDAAALRARGVERVVFAAGELDSAAASMKRAHAKLLRAGFPSRWVSLGRVYHTLPPDSAARLAEAVAWAAAGGGARI